MTTSLAANNYCFHCGLDNPSGGLFSANINQQEVYFCCPGCQAVAETINAAGLDNYYNYRDRIADTVDLSFSNTDYLLYDNMDFQQDFVEQQDNISIAQLSVQGIHCAACTWLIENQLSKTDGIFSSNVNLANHKASIRWDNSKLKLSDIFRTINAIGYKTAPWLDDEEIHRSKQENKASMARIGVAGIGMMQVGMYSIALHAGSLQGIADTSRDLMRYSAMIMATLVILFSARPFFEGAWRGIKNHHPGMDLPVAIAIGFAYVASCWATLQSSGEVYFDSVVMFTFFLLLSRHMEMRSRHNLNRKSANLATHTPEFAWKIKSNGEQQQVLPKTLVVGDNIIIKPGERIPADAVITRGLSSVDESVINGEYLPIEKSSGDVVTAGGLNGDGFLECKVTAIGKDTQLSIINQLLEHAQQSVPPIAILADKGTKSFVSVVLITSACVYVYWHFVAPEQAFWIALSVMVVSCPCALSMATPTALTAATGALREQGLLVRDGNSLEALTKVTHCIFDKTGTITEGKLNIADIKTMGQQSADYYRHVAASLESYSSHPIASALSQKQTLLTVTDPQIVPGQGISGLIEKREYCIGSDLFIGSHCQLPELSSNENMLPIYLSENGRLAAIFYLQDQLRPSAAKAINQLNRMNIATILLSGDSSNMVKSIAEELDFSDWQNKLKPADKLSYIEKIKANNGICIAVGDGINDVPLLGAANISIAVANATDLTRNNADCIMLANDLRNIPLFIEKSKQTQKIIRQNLGWALAYNVCALPLASMGLVPPYIAALGMSASSLVVVINAMRLWKTPATQLAQSSQALHSNQTNQPRQVTR
jgi:Cu2+-exporting ATPase